MQKLLAKNENVLDGHLGLAAILCEIQVKFHTLY
jgi:hypothetical protein